MKEIFPVYIILSVLTLSCSDRRAERDLAREQLIADGVEIKVSEFREREWQKCVEQARSLAVARVDSLIRAMARQDAIEPVFKPPKPERPVKPDTRVLPDSLRQKLKNDSID
jgi:hypothetical protein